MQGPALCRGLLIPRGASDLQGLYSTPSHPPPILPLQSYNPRMSSQEFLSQSRR